MSGGGRRGGAPRRRAGGVLPWIPATAWLGLITWLSHRPRIPLAGGAPDWLLHGVEYAILGCLVASGAVLSGVRPGWRLAAAGLAFCAAAGVLDEYHQSFVPGRDASAGDALADAVGGAAGVSAEIWRRARRRAAGRSPARVILVGRRDCRLCDEAEAVLRRVLPAFEAAWSKVDLDDRPEFAVYREECPVVLVNGRKAFKYRVDAARLRRRLARWEKGESP